MELSKNNLQSPTAITVYVVCFIYIVVFLYCCFCKKFERKMESQSFISRWRRYFTTNNFVFPIKFLSDRLPFQDTRVKLMKTWTTKKSKGFLGLLAVLIVFSFGIIFISIKRPCGWILAILGKNQKKAIPDSKETLKKETLQDPEIQKTAISGSKETHKEETLQDPEAVNTSSERDNEHKVTEQIQSENKEHVHFENESHATKDKEQDEHTSTQNEAEKKIDSKLKDRGSESVSTINEKQEKRKKKKKSGNKNIPADSKVQKNEVKEVESYKGFPNRPKGFPNIGNTCFMDSVLQNLVWTPLLGYQLSKDTAKRGATIALFELYKQVHNSTDTRDVVNRHHLETVLNAARSHNSQFFGLHQQDSFEMFNTLIGGIQDEQLKVDPYGTNADGTEIEHTMKRCHLTRLMGGMYMTVYYYETCHHVELTFQMFTSICVPVPKSEKEYEFEEVKEEKDSDVQYSNKNDRNSGIDNVFISTTDINGNTTEAIEDEINLIDFTSNGVESREETLRGGSEMVTNEDIEKSERTNNHLDLERGCPKLCDNKGKAIHTKNVVRFEETEKESENIDAGKKKNASSTIEDIYRRNIKDIAKSAEQNNYSDKQEEYDENVNYDKRKQLAMENKNGESREKNTHLGDGMVRGADLSVETGRSLDKDEIENEKKGEEKENAHEINSKIPAQNTKKERKDRSGFKSIKIDDISRKEKKDGKGHKGQYSTSEAERLSESQIKRQKKKDKRIQQKQKRSYRKHNNSSPKNRTDMKKLNFEGQQIEENFPKSLSTNENKLIEQEINEKEARKKTRDIPKLVPKDDGITQDDHDRITKHTTSKTEISAIEANCLYDSTDDYVVSSNNKEEADYREKAVNTIVEESQNEGRGFDIPVEFSTNSEEKEMEKDAIANNKFRNKSSQHIKMDSPKEKMDYFNFEFRVSNFPCKSLEYVNNNVVDDGKVDSVKEESKGKPETNLETNIVKEGEKRKKGLSEKCTQMNKVSHTNDEMTLIDIDSETSDIVASTCDYTFEHENTTVWREMFDHPLEPVKVSTVEPVSTSDGLLNTERKNDHYELLNDHSQKLHDAVASLLPLEIGNGKKLKGIECGLIELTQTEEFDENLLCCRICEQKNPTRVGNKKTVKKLFVISPPPVLVLQINRFKQVGTGLTKIDDTVSYPEILNLTPFCSSAAEVIDPKNICVRYSLYGIVAHSGSLNGGHYVAYIKASGRDADRLLEKFINCSWKDPERLEKEIIRYFGDKSTVSYAVSLIENVSPTSKDDQNKVIGDEGKWYYISDSQVQRCAKNDVLDNGNAYILFYERIE